jgi:glycerol-3-phosphate acyltransferase PlsY
MFSFWLGKLAKKDVRDYGDGNPGATNAWKAGGWSIGLPGALLDYAKGAVPVGLAVWVAGIEGWFLVPVVLAPVLGHAFSPFLKFKGGKAIAVTLGVWSGLTVWEGVLVLGIIIGIFYTLLDHPSWSVILAMITFLAYLLFKQLFILHQLDMPILAVWTGNMLISLYKHKGDLGKSIQARPFVARIFRRTS